MTKELADELLVIDEEHRGILSGAERTALREAAARLLAATEPPTDEEMARESRIAMPNVMGRMSPAAAYLLGYRDGARREGRR